MGGFPIFGSFYRRFLFLLPFASESFNYDDPNKWYLDFPQCGGYKQSPISIHTHKTYIVNLTPLIFGLYDVLLNEVIHLHNNGHTIKFDIPPTILNEKPFITGGLLDDFYEAEEVHFHWGSRKTKGSEHLLNGKRYDVEMHIVHKNTKYKDVKSAREHTDGLAVVAVLFKVVKAPNVYFPGLNQIYNTLEDVIDYNSTASTDEIITLGSLLGHIDRETFFTYKGSLTTPPCSESVIWHVFPEVIPISHVELPKFWKILDARGRVLKNNIRPLQSIEYRKVFYRKPINNFIFQ